MCSDNIISVCSGLCDIITTDNGNHMQRFTSLYTVVKYEHMKSIMIMFDLLYRQNVSPTVEINLIIKDI